MTLAKLADVKKKPIKPCFMGFFYGFKLAFYMSGGASGLILV